MTRLNLGRVATAQRRYERALRRSDRVLFTLAEEIRTARLVAGTSQRAVATAARMSNAKVSRIEAGKLRSLTLVDALIIADAVGLDLSCKAYPGRPPTRDAGHARRISELLSHVRAPLTCRVEVPLPTKHGAIEQRAWDAMLFAEAGKTGIELEMRLHDVQAQTRRLLLKWRDSDADRLLLLVADTAGNRRVFREFPDYFKETPRLGTAKVIAALERGERPPTGLIFV